MYGRRLHNGAQPRSPPRAVCSAPFCSHCTPMTAFPDIYYSVVKYVDNTTIIRYVTNTNEHSYQEAMNNHAKWCSEDNLLLNVSKAKKLLVDFKKGGGGETHPCLHQFS